MAAHRYWRVLVVDVHTGNYVQIQNVYLRATAGGSNLAVHPTTGTASSSSTNNGSSTWAWDGNGGWSSLISDPFPQWTQFVFTDATEVLEAVIVNGPGYTSAYAVTIQSSDDGSTWDDVVDFLNSGDPNASTSIYWGPAEHGTFALAAPKPVVSSFGGWHAACAAARPTLVVGAGARPNLTAPKPTLDAHAGHRAALVAPMPSVSSYAIGTADANGAAVVCPKPTAVAYAGSRAALRAPRGAVALTATLSSVASANIEAPKPQLDVHGRVSETSSAALRAPMPDVIGYGGAVCSITITGKHTVQATGTTGTIGRATIEAPLFELTAIGTAQNYGGADLIAPAARLGATAQAWLIAPGATLTAIGTAVVAVSYEAYAVTLPRGTDAQGNAAPAAVTHYTNYPFDYVVRYRNSYFGANASGLYLLEGTTDDGTAIPFAVQTHLSDFKTPNLKTVASAYLSGRIGAAETVSLTAGENNPITHNFTTPRGAKAQNHRQKFGLGTKARYFSVGVSGNQQFELDAVELEVATMQRRI